MDWPQVSLTPEPGLLPGRAASQARGTEEFCWQSHTGNQAACLCGAGGPGQFLAYAFHFPLTGFYQQ